MKCCLSALSHPINATAEVLGLLRSFVWIANKIPRFITGCKRVLISSKALINMDIKCIHHLHNNAIPSSQFRVSSGPPGFCKGFGTPSHPLFQASAKHEGGIMRTKRAMYLLSVLSVSYLTSPEAESMSLYWWLTWRWRGWASWWWWSDDRGWEGRRRECSLLKWNII